MKLRLTTKVNQTYLKVKDGFNADLFKALNPPFPPVKLLRFDGSSKGDTVSLELNFIFFRQVWTSEIVSEHMDASEYYFVDQGVDLPFFLKKWKHKHRIVSDGNTKSKIIDEINFSSPHPLLDYLLYPILYFQFSMRKPIYQKFFGSNKG